jgi:sugar diacid utilization regulator
MFEGLAIEEIKRRAAIMDFYLPAKGLILLIKGLEEKNLDKTISKIFSEHTLCGMLEDELAIVYVDCTQKYEDKISCLYDEIKSVSRVRSIVIGVGNAVDLDKIGRSCEEAKSALEIGTYLKSDPGIYYFNQLGIYQLLKISNIKEEMKSFYEKHLKPLESQGEDNYMNLIKTIECYIRNAYSFTETAEELYVHPNTVRYRIGIVEKLCNISFKNADDRLNMEVTFKMLPFLNKVTLQNSEFH